MIIIIRETPDFVADKNGKLRALENILAAAGECKHLLWMPTQAVDSLLGVDELSGYAKRILFELKSFVRETRGIEAIFDFYVVVDFDDAGRLDDSNAGELVVGYGHFKDSGSTQKCSFITENLRDAEAFKIGAEIYLCKHRLSRAHKVSLRLAPGGGNTTYDSFLDYKKEDVFFLCVIDSDLKHPKGAKGTTATRFNGERKGLQGKGYLNVLECHEIENIIPIKIASIASDGKIEEGLILKRGKSIRYRLFPDHKNGLCVNDAAELDEKHNDDFWKEFYADVTAGRKIWLIPPLGENFLSDSLRIMAETSTAKLLEMIDESEDELWWTTSRLVASWGIAMKRPIP
ncbi:TPA: hypothetical protein L4F26_002017 [Pseudomonas aeruginosa]|uniref:hypothetical protein n=1 Tax=Pseudomonas aeruginosa TaxID=287 RepID=UPI001F4B3192|nr:hypothetical protein [Pseudomonas aeruginosa]HBO1399271.1 hypothetical protein [Pseudomonas aeruginosa]HBO1795195.1 hypothetical protein [Pseudomonas aeruginosa]